MGADFKLVSIVRDFVTRVWKNILMMYCMKQGKALVYARFYSRLNVGKQVL